MNHSNLFAIVLVLGLGNLSLACDKESTTSEAAKPDAAATEVTRAETPTPAAVAPAPVAINDSDLVTAADFEEEADKAITSKNYKAELASLETELNKE